MPPGTAAGPSTLERWFLQLSLSISLAAWVAILSAELGLFSLDALLAAVGLGCLVLWSSGTRVTSTSSSRDSLRRQALAAGAAVMLAAALFFPAYPTVLWASDSTVYVNFSRQISKTGSLVFRDRLLTGLAPETKRVLFENSTPEDVTGAYTRLPGGFLIPDPTDDKVTAGFSPLFPIALALFHQLFGMSGTLLVAPLFAVLSVGAMFLVGARLHSTLTGLLSATLLAVSVPQIWFAKFGLPAVVAQFFVLAGLLALLLALRCRHAPLGGLAGWLFGTAMFAKFDLIAVLTVSALAFVVVGLFSESRSQRMTLTYCALGLVAPLSHNVMHFLVFPSHYAAFLGRAIGTTSLLGLLTTTMTVGLALAAVTVAILFTVVRRASVRQVFNWVSGARAWGVVLSCVLVGYSVAYVSSSQNRLTETVAWLGWFLSWPMLALFLIGLLGLLRTWRRERDLGSGLRCHPRHPGVPALPL